MKGIFFLVQNLALGKKILYFDHEQEWAEQKAILKDFQSKVTLISGNAYEKACCEDAVGLKYGMTKAFFREMFLPKASNFQNDLNEVTIEQNRYIFYPYYFQDDSDDQNQNPNKKQKKTGGQQAKVKVDKMLREKKQLIEQLVQTKQIPEEKQAELEAKIT